MFITFLSVYIKSENCILFFAVVRYNKLDVPRHLDFGCLSLVLMIIIIIVLFIVMIIAIV